MIDMYFFLGVVVIVVELMLLIFIFCFIKFFISFWVVFDIIVLIVFIGMFFWFRYVVGVKFILVNIGGNFDYLLIKVRFSFYFLGNLILLNLIFEFLSFVNIFGNFFFLLINL